MTNGGYRRIFVGISGSLSSFTALHRAVELARRSDAELHAVLATAPGIHTVDHIQLEQSMAARLLASILESAFGADGCPPDVSFSAHSVLGGAGPILTQMADRENDLIVIGAARRRRLPDFSTMRYCTTHAACPVLVVPTPALPKMSPAIRLGIRER
ncbi:universal stress protein [Streptomyces vinaceus]|uniref:universal stress protein n=1 Tax=Streptomyces vinaceus TaxID=1960 RepID=UPI0035DD84E2